MLSKNKKIIALTVVGLIAISTTVGWILTSEKEPPVVEKVIIDTYRDLKIEAEAVYVYDIKYDKVLFAKNPEQQLPLASITKIMSAVVALEKAPGNFNVRTHDILLPERGGGDIYPGEWWKLKDLVNFSLVTSSNDGALAIASAVGALGQNGNSSAEDSFVSQMNSKARTLGLYQTYFVNSSGLDISANLAGAYGSVKDSAMLISYAYKNFPEIMESTSETRLYVESLSGIVHNVENTNEIAGQIAGLSASKTGYTDLAGGNLAVVFEAGPLHPIAIVVLGSSRDGRFSDVKKLYEATLLYINKNYE